MCATRQKSVSHLSLDKVEEKETGTKITGQKRWVLSTLYLI